MTTIDKQCEYKFQFLMQYRYVSADSRKHYPTKDSRVVDNWQSCNMTQWSTLNHHKDKQCPFLPTLMVESVWIDASLLWTRSAKLLIFGGARGMHSSAGFIRITMPFRYQSNRSSFFTLNPSFQHYLFDTSTSLDHFHLTRLHFIRIYSFKALPTSD